MANSGSYAPIVTKFIFTGRKKKPKHTHTITKNTMELSTNPTSTT